MDVTSLSPTVHTPTTGYPTDGASIVPSATPTAEDRNAEITEEEDEVDTTAINRNEERDENDQKQMDIFVVGMVCFGCVVLSFCPCACEWSRRRRNSKAQLGAATSSSQLAHVSTPISKRVSSHSEAVLMNEMIAHEHGLDDAHNLVGTPGSADFEVKTDDGSHAQPSKSAKAMSLGADDEVIGDSEPTRTPAEC